MHVLDVIQWSWVSWRALVEPVLVSLVVVFFSEIGDRSFVAVLKLQEGGKRLPVFVGAMLGVVVSTLGMFFVRWILFPEVSQLYVLIFSATVFVVLGIMSAIECFQDFNNPDGEEADTVLQKIPLVKKGTEHAMSGFRKIVLTFCCVFLLEVGDRSQVAATTLSLSYNTPPVIVGTILGHVFSNGLAILTGRYILEHFPAPIFKLVNVGLFFFFGIADMLSAINIYKAA